MMISLYTINLKLIVAFLIKYCYSQEFKGFDDTILYKINWPGKVATDRLLKEHDENMLAVKTNVGESYHCFLPKQDEVNKESKQSYDGPSPLVLLSPLMSKEACSYRVDTYWVYEVCHGRHVRQYHNERVGMTKNDQEYYLGVWKMFDSLKLEEELKRLANLNYPGPTKTRKIDGVNLPYFEMNMSGGTICDLNGRPRQTSVLYVCYPQSIHNVFSVKETTTCQYEVIILTSLLCTHPWYKPPNSDELNIDCIAVEDSPRKPFNLKVLESDTFKLKKQMKMLTDSLSKKENYILAVSIDKNGETKIQVKIQPNTETDYVTKEDSLSLPPKRLNNEIEDFVTGNICLYGGSGWWKYEICYNKYIRQVHKEKGKPDDIIVLGAFNLEEHIKWLSRNEEKKPNLNAHDKRQLISHFYSSGSICEKTGLKRETEVRYKCVKDGYNEDTVALYMLEPKTCKYILTIESPSLCELINGPIDEHGIFIIKTDSDNKDEKSSSSETQHEEKVFSTWDFQEYIKTGETVEKKSVENVKAETETEVPDDKKKISKIEL